MTLRTLPLALLLLAGLSASAASGAATQPLMQSPELRIPVPPTPVRVAGERILAYELHVTNLRAVDVELTRIAVQDAARGVSLADYRDAQLANRIGRPGVRSEVADKRVIAGGMRAVVFFWIALDPDSPTPARLSHRVEFTALRESGREHGVVDALEIDIRRQVPVILDAPLRDGPWVALYDPAMAGGHRTSIYAIDGTARIPARFAIDWVRLDEKGARASGDASQVANWHGHGAEVLAVADAIVASVRDDMPGPASVGASQGPITLANASGNYVALDLGEGRHAFYEHLKHGSVRVRAGERVRRGQVIAELGNTGSSSSGPHLHFHVSDAGALLGAEGLPYVFRSFTVLGAFATIDAAVSDARWNPPPARTQGVRTMELPAANVVVSFPARTR